MYATDFEYDGEFLSDYGFVICNFDGVDDINVVDTGAQITFNRVSVQNGRRQYLASTEYEDCIETTFDIIKNPCLNSDYKISSDEYRDLIRWLNRHQFYWFQFINYEENIDPIYYHGSFQVQKILVGGIFNGVRLTLVTDAPWGYGQRMMAQRNMNATTSMVILDQSDEAGNIYPYVSIVCLEAGDLTLTNKNLNVSTVVNNCVKGETITFSGSTLLVSSSESSHDLTKDFNFVFPVIGNTYRKRQNELIVSLACQLYVEYRPIIKDVL